MLSYWHHFLVIQDFPQWYQATYLLIVIIIRHVYDNSNNYSNWTFTTCQAKYTHTHTHILFILLRKPQERHFFRWWNWGWLWQDFRVDLFDSKAQICCISPPFLSITSMNILFYSNWLFSKCSSFPSFINTFYSYFQLWKWFSHLFLF